MAKVTKPDPEVNERRFKAQIADLQTVVKGQEERLQDAARDRSSLAQENEKLQQLSAKLTAELTDARAAAVAPPARSADEILAEVTNHLMELPDNSPLKAAVIGFMDALVENYKDGPGAPGRAAFAILEAATNGSDPAYAALNVTQRMTATSMANMLKQSFRK